MVLDKDMMQYKLTVPTGMTYYFASADHMTKALIEGGGNRFMTMCCYAVKDGKFHKNRSAGNEIPNVILALGRDKINELFDFMEKH